MVGFHFASAFGAATSFGMIIFSIFSNYLSLCLFILLSTYIYNMKEACRSESYRGILGCIELWAIVHTPGVPLDKP